MATVAKSTRTTTITLASASAGPFDLSFRLFDDDAIDVYVNNLPRTDWTLSSTYADGYDDNATITFDAALAINDVVHIFSDLYPNRADDYLNSAGLTEKINIELARLWSSVSDLRRDKDYGLRTFSAVERFKPAASSVFGADADGDFAQYSIDTLTGNDNSIVTKADRAALVAYLATTTPPADTVLVAADTGLMWRFYSLSWTDISDMTGCRPMGPVCGAHFGTNTTEGTTDMTTALTAATTYCNSTGDTLHLWPWKAFAVDADAQFEHNFSIDCGGATLHILNGVEVTPDTTYNTIFIPTDSATPAVSGTHTVVSSAYLVQGSTNPSYEFFTGQGYVEIASDVVKIPKRYKNDIFDSGNSSTYDPYRQPFAVVRAGEVIHPLEVDLSAATTVDYVYREMSSRGKIEIRDLNVVLDPAIANNQCIVEAKRNDVDVRNITIYADGDWTSSTQISRLFRTEYAAWFQLENVIAHAMPNAGNLLNPQNSAEITIRGCTAIEGWGALGGNYISGYHIHDNNLSRIDGHAGIGNVFASGNTIVADTQWAGFQYGWGFGSLKFTGNTVVKGPLMQTRGDFANQWYGSMQFDSNTIQRPKNPCVLIDVGGNGAPGMNGFTLRLARSWSITNTTIENNGTDPLTVTPILLSQEETATAVTGATTANPVVITSPGHDREDGDVVYLSSFGGMTQVNDTVAVVANATANTFELQGVDGSAYGTYTSGGYVCDPLGNVYLPDSIIVENIICGGNWRVRQKLDLESFEKDTSLDSDRKAVSLVMRGIHATNNDANGTAGNESFYIPTPLNSGASADVDVDLHLIDCQKISLNTANSNDVYVYARDSWLDKVNTAGSVVLSLNDCKLLPPIPGTADNIVGLAGSSSAHTSMFNVVLEDDGTYGWDMQHVKELGFVRAIDNDDTYMTWPAGATKATAFTGWENI